MNLLTYSHYKYISPAYQSFDLLSCLTQPGRRSEFIHYLRESVPLYGKIEIFKEFLRFVHVLKAILIYVYPDALSHFLNLIAIFTAGSAQDCPQGNIGRNPNPSKCFQKRMNVSGNYRFLVEVEITQKTFMNYCQGPGLVENRDGRFEAVKIESISHFQVQVAV